MWLIILLSILEALLIVISSVVRIQEWSALLLGVFLCIGAIYYSSRKKCGRNRRYLVLALSLASTCMGIWFSAFSPYWGSKTILDVIGFPYQQTNEIDSYLSTKDAIADIRYAVEKVKRVHPACLHGLQDEVKNLYNNEIEQLSEKDSVDICELHQHLQKLLSPLNDAHTKILPVWRTRHRIDYSQYGEIHSLNGIPRSDFIGLYGDLFSSETEAWTASEISLSCNSYEGLRFLGLFDKDTLSVEFINQDSLVCTRSFVREDFKTTSTSTKDYSLLTDEFSVCKYDDYVSAGYLNLRNCYYYTPIQRNRLNRELKSFFKQVRERKYNHIVIDLRNNPGGNIALAYELLKYFPIDRYSTGKRHHRKGPIIFGKKKNKKNKQYKDFVFDGDVYVLTSLYTFSAAMHLADYLQGNNLARIVGESPGNTPTCYSDIAHFVLPKSRLSLFISTAQYYRVDETQDINLIIPNIDCHSDSAYKTLRGILRADRNVSDDN